jgi:fibronectin type 3 domain-containing protein
MNNTILRPWISRFHFGSCVILLLAAILLFPGCHDAPRKNPFDPELTPPVELAVALDATAGTATLTWTPYAGDQAFAGYRVLRNVTKSTEVDTLEVIDEVSRTTFVDSSLAADTVYDYRVAVVNARGFEMASAAQRVDGYTARAVHLLALGEDHRAGTVALVWTRYRDPDFESYRVHRRAVGTDQIEKLGSISALDDTIFSDGTLRADIDYLYTVVVQAGGQELTSNAREGRLALPAVELDDPKFDSTTASAELVWTPYAGPRLRSYRVLRSTAGQLPQAVAEIEDRRVTSFVDTGLVGNTEYFYQVEVVTTQGEEVVSPPVGGAFHRLVATWPLEVDERDFVRLYVEEEGRLTALVTERIQSFYFRGETHLGTGLAARLLVFDGEGGLLEERVLYEELYDRMALRSAATVASPDGGRFLSLGKLGSVCNDWEGDGWRTAEIVNFGPDGEYRWFSERPLFAGVLSNRIVEDGGKAVGEITLVASGGAFFDNVVVSSGGQVLFAEDFDGAGLDAYLEEWETFYPSYGTHVHPQLAVENGRAFMEGVNWIHKIDATWQSIRIQADVGIGKPWGQLALGLGRQSGPGGSSYIAKALWLTQCNEAILSWSGAEGYEELIPERYDERLGMIEAEGTPYRLALEVVDGKGSASVRSPVWFEDVEEDPEWTNLIVLGETMLLNAGKQFFSITPEEHLALPVTLGSQVSEMRLWKPLEDDPNARPWIGVCLPEEGQVILNRLRLLYNGHVEVPFQVKRPSIGAGLGTEPGHFVFPLSFDLGGPDRQVYVLDAGNARIQAFDMEGNYITQWGHKGSGPGEFNFGSGRAVEDFAGSVAVDGDGFIYVADVGNGRIQKFAP